MAEIFRTPKSLGCKLQEHQVFYFLIRSVTIHRVRRSQTQCLRFKVDWTVMYHNLFCLHRCYDMTPWIVLQCPWISWPSQLQSTMMTTLQDLTVTKNTLKLHSNVLRIPLRRDTLIKDWGRTCHRKNNGKRRMIFVEVKVEVSSGYLLLRIVMLRVIIETLS